jgi:hypothetical protein
VDIDALGTNDGTSVACHSSRDKLASLD